LRVRTGNWLWGLCIMAFGVLWLLNQVNVLEFSVFFRGWWTLFIIIPCLISMVQIGINTGSLIGLGVGVILLLAQNEIVEVSIIFPLIVIVVGLSILFKRPFHTSKNWAPPAVPTGADKDHAAVFSGQTISPEGERYTGGSFSAVFGGIKLDLRRAVIDQDIRIETTSVFGGVELFIPDYCRVVTKGTHVFGGTTNRRKGPQPTTGPIIYLESTCIFGGVTID